MKKITKKVILIGALVLASLLAAVWYAGTFNNWRLVEPIGNDFSVKMIFPFCFFVFFGFFGFFFEGKMSGTFMDERFQENVKKAQLTSMKTGFIMMWFVLLLLARGHRFFSNLEHIAVAYTIAISLVIGVTVFLGEYLLYRYDHDEQEDLSED